VEQAGQVGKVMCRGGPLGKGRELVIPDPKLELMDQVHEVMRVRHQARRTEESYCDWSRRLEQPQSAPGSQALREEDPPGHRARTLPVEQMFNMENALHFNRAAA